MNVKLTAKQKTHLSDNGSIYRILQAILLRENTLRRAQEHFWVMGFNNADKLLFVELISLGSDNRVAVKAPEVFRMAIYKTATRVVFAHNHPSGTLAASDGDRNVTDRLLKAGEIINIEVVDHFVITETGYLSFREAGIMEQLRTNGNYKIVSNHRKQMEALRLEMAKEEAEREKARTIATKMKLKGYDDALIKELTGLRLAEIKKLPGANKE